MLVKQIKITPLVLSVFVIIFCLCLCNACKKEEAPLTPEKTDSYGNYGWKPTLYFEMERETFKSIDWKSLRKKNFLEEVKNLKWFRKDLTEFKSISYFFMNRMRTRPASR